MVAICVALRDRASPEEVLERAPSTMTAFEIEGGMAQLYSQLLDGKVIPRRPGNPVNAGNRAAVAYLRAQGFSQAEISKKLALSKSTVNRYWKLIAS